MRKRLLISLTTVSLVSIFAVKLTNSFFSDTETSQDNTFKSGKIDLKIDNTSYYNGDFSENTSWNPDDLTNHKFFDFTDLKPGDWGEDTISIKVEDNDSWLCAAIDITKDDDNDCTEPERIDDPACSENDDLFDGEVGGLVNIVFWVDDGDNVLEENETNNIFTQGTVKDVLTNASWSLSQSGTPNDRIFLQSTLNENGSMIGGDTYYIAKYWCFGEITQNAVSPGNNSPQENPGFTCNGEGINNAPQTDSLLANISFHAEQSRHNENFLCNVEAIEVIEY